MSRREEERTPQGELGLSSFGNVSDDQGVSLEKLSESFARLLGQGEEPYSPADSDPTLAESAPGETGEGDADPFDDSVDSATAAEEGVCPITPASILEAMLFVGHPENEPLASGQIAALMRGVRAAEINELVRQLNGKYAEEGCPYRIESVGGGYRMSLTGKYDPLREKFYGKLRQAKLSQPAIDVLAIVAYNQPILREQVDRLRERPSGSILSQLVRRQLLQIEWQSDGRRKAEFSTTDRFLDLFGLESLDALPQGQELDPSG